MNFDQPVPDSARQTLARLGTQIEYTEGEPNGIVNLAISVADASSTKGLAAVGRQVFANGTR